MRLQGGAEELFSILSGQIGLRGLLFCFFFYFRRIKPCNTHHMRRHMSKKKNSCATLSKLDIMQGLV